MQLQSILQLLIAGNMATLATAAPAPDPAPDALAALPEIDLSTHAKREITQQNVEAYLEANNITVTTGTFSVSDSEGNPNVARQAIPGLCQFETNRGSFTYMEFKGIIGSACFGFANQDTCNGDGSWPDPDWTHIQHSMGTQVTQDGRFRTSRVGAWNANFHLLTTAFSNRDTSLFSLGLALSPARRNRVYYWQRDGDMAATSRDTSIFGGC